MKIGIIGVGNIGGTLVRQYSKAGHHVKMTNASGIEKLKDLASETGASGVSLADVINDVDAIIISIPMLEVPKLPKGLFEKVPANTPIVDTGNYYPLRDGKIADIENGMPESVWVSNQIRRPIIKAYNNILAGSLMNSGRSKGDPQRLALPVSGDNKESKNLVSTLLDVSGFDSYDYGTLEESWRQQPGSPAYCTDLNLSQLKKAIAKTRRDLLPGRRDLGLSFILKHKPEQFIPLYKEFAQHFRVIYESDLEV
ncbi:MAG: hypothetical protein C5B52_07075 [Bacteroidetes bacterium]|nr:MAG: hypothetical protein C5B52_07075 [Bacteroidota bacterium]